MNKSKETKKPKLLVIDVEGTIFKATMKIDGTDYPSTMWQPIAMALGDAAVDEERKTHEKWDSKEYDNYLDWVKATIDIHRKYGLKKDVFMHLVNCAEYNTGVEEFFRELNRKKWIPVLISGGFQNLIRRAQNELDIEYGFGACEYYFHEDDGLLEHYNLQPADFDGKVKFLHSMLSEYDLDKSKDWVFVGDGKNDEIIARQAPQAFGINPHEKLKTLDGLIEISSFTELLPYLDKLSQEKTAGKRKVHTDEDDRTISVKHEYLSDMQKLERLVHQLKIENNKIKQDNNDQKGRIEKRQKGIKVNFDSLYYEITPRIPLEDFLQTHRVVFFGLNKEHEPFKRLSGIKNLKVIPGFKNNFDASIIKNCDFLFVYTSEIAHADVERACTKMDKSLAYCFLGPRNNDQLIRNALANVLYHYFYGK